MIRVPRVSTRVLTWLAAVAVALAILSAVDSCSGKATADSIEWKVREEYLEATRKRITAERDSAIALLALTNADVDRGQERHSRATETVRARPELMADRDVVELVDAGDSLSRMVDQLQARADSAVGLAVDAAAAADSVTLAVREQLEAERRAARPRLTASASLLWDFLHQVPVVRTAVNLRINDRLQLAAGAEAAGPGVNGIEARLTAGTTYTFR